MLVLYTCQRGTKKIVQRQSINTPERGCIAFFLVCTTLHTGSGANDLKGGHNGLSLGCLSVPEFLLLGVKVFKLLLLCMSV